jgi:hypothetical protein
MSRSSVPARYERYRRTKMWRVIGREVQRLEENGDLVLQTPRVYVIGALCESIARSRTRTGAKKQ